MATEKKEKGARKGGDKREVVKVDHTGVGLPVPAPRRREQYMTKVRPALTKQFGFKNPHQVPTLEKIVLNVGAGEAIKQPKFLDKVVEELGLIAGQQAVRKKAKKSIANYGLREGQEIGAAVTLRGSFRSRSRGSVTSRACRRARSTDAATIRSA